MNNALFHFFFIKIWLSGEGGGAARQMSLCYLQENLENEKTIKNNPIRFSIQNYYIGDANKDSPQRA